MPPREVTVQRVCKMNAGVAVQLSPIPVIWCCHLLGTFFSTKFNHTLGQENQNSLRGDDSHFHLCMWGRELFLEELTFLLPLHQACGGANPNSSRTASSSPAGLLSHLPNMPRAIASVLCLPQSFVPELQLEGFRFLWFFFSLL